MSEVFGSADQDDVFRALADPFRRELLDRLHSHPGSNVGELTRGSGRSRYAVMRHLRLLEDASLISSRRVGRERQLYVNGAPLQAIYDRWMSRHAGVFAELVSGLTREAERPATHSSDTDAPGRVRGHRFVEYIRTTPERLWQALTDSEQTRLYYHGLEVESRFEVGAPIRYLRTSEDGGTRVDVDGVIFDIEPGRRLAHTFRFPGREEPATRARYDIQPLASAVRLTLDHDGFTGPTETYRITADGWPPILSSLKSYLESGAPLEI